MFCSVELYFDPVSTAKIEDLKRFLKSGGISPEENVKPHISLAVYDSPDEKLLIERVGNFSKRNIDISISISHTGFFPTDEGVLFLAPKVTPQLLKLHTDFLNQVPEFKEKLSPYYDIGVWVPHITLAVGLNQAELQRAVALLAARVKDFSAAVIQGIGITAFPPVRQTFEINL